MLDRDELLGIRRPEHAAFVGVTGPAVDSQLRLLLVCLLRRTMFWFLISAVHWLSGEELPRASAPRLAALLAPPASAPRPGAQADRPNSVRGGNSASVSVFESRSKFHVLSPARK